MNQSCKHKWKFWAHSGRALYYRCAKCSEEKDIEFNKTEQKRAMVLMKKGWKDAGDVHKCMFDFRKRFMDKEAREYKWTGYPLMKRVERWAKKWPEDVQICGCDDDSHSGSDLILIQHQSPHSYMGCSVVFIPQCTGEPPTLFFLYPCDNHPLIKALQFVKKQEKIKRTPDPRRKEFEEFQKKVEEKARKKGLL